MIQIESKVWTPQEILHSLPPDDETPARALVFRAFVEQSCQHPLVADALEELYQLAADYPGSMSLHDSNMLLSALELNPALAQEVRGSVNRLLGADTAMGIRTRIRAYWQWLDRKEQSTILEAG